MEYTDKTTESNKNKGIVVSVIMVSFNTIDMTRDALNTLYKNSGGYELDTIVVDNDSRDGSANMIESEFPEVTLIRNEVNAGFAPANVQGYAVSRGDYVLMLNTDAFVDERAIRDSVEYMEQHEDCGIVGVRLVGTDGDMQPCARKFPSPLDKLIIISGLATRFPESHFFGRADLTFWAHDADRVVDWVPGAFTMIRRKMLEQTGFLDTDYFIYYEETDFCLRASRNGWNTVFLHGPSVVHIGGVSSRRVKGQTFSKHGSQLLLWRLQSEYLYYRKNFGITGTMLSALVEAGWHTLRALGSAVRFDRTGKAKDSSTVVRTIITALRKTRFGAESPAQPW